MMIGIVMGLLTHTTAMVRGKLLRVMSAAVAAAGVCIGTGGNSPIKTPQKKALDTERRFIWNKLGLSSSLPKKRKDLLRFSVSGDGISFFNEKRDMQKPSAVIDARLHPASLEDQLMALAEFKS
jgi:hypothetical protein